MRTYTFEEVTAIAKPSSKLVAALATHRRYDLATRCIAGLLDSSSKPDRILVIDNGGSYQSPFGDIVEVVRPGYNVGCSGAWNLIGRLSAPHDCLIVGDDILVHKETVRIMRETPGMFVCRKWFGCFLIRRACWDIIGEFDELFWPCGHEDIDYHRRMRLIIPTRPDGTPELPYGAVPADSICDWGGIVQCYKDDSIQHMEGGSASSSPSSGWIHDWIWKYGIDYRNRKWGDIGGLTEFPYTVPYNGQPTSELEYRLEWWRKENQNLLPKINDAMDRARGATTVRQMGLGHPVLSLAIGAAGPKKVILRGPERAPIWPAAIPVLRSAGIEVAFEQDQQEMTPADVAVEFKEA